MYGHLGYRRLFSKNEDGNVAILFGICVIVFMMLIGVAVDTGRAYYASSKTLAALDTAALATAKAMKEEGLSDSELQLIAEQYFQANSHEAAHKGVDFGELKVTVDRDKGSVNVEITGSVEASFARIMNVKEIPFSKSSSAIYNIKDIELAMMLDVTGSMRGSKLNDLQLAAKDLVNILIQDHSSANKTRIGLAPYSAAVNAGSYASAVSDGVSQDGCVFERDGFNAYTDAVPVPGHFLSAMENPRTPSNTQYGCPESEVVPLTNDKNLLTRTLDSYRAGGWTAGHLGTAWAWYLVSPEWASIWPVESRPVAYGNKKTIKAVILMTDGAYNTSYKNGPVNRKSTTQARIICDNMKDEGLVVYSIAFQAPASAKETLQYCALSGKHYFDAENGVQLREAFRDIAIRLTRLRISE